MNRLTTTTQSAFGKKSNKSKQRMALEKRLEKKESPAEEKTETKAFEKTEKD